MAVTQSLWLLLVHIYKCEDSFAERKRGKMGRGVLRGGGDYEAQSNSPKNNLQLWMNTLSESNLNTMDVCV